MKAAILGTSGYTGLIFLRLLADHPEIQSVIPVSSSKAGELVNTLDPGLSPGLLKKTDLTKGRMTDLEGARALKPDVVFAALPHLKSAELCAPFVGQAIVIDLSADMRIKDPEIFTRAYKTPPPRPDLLEKAVYGLVEWNREEIKKAEIIAGPGCYPTSSLLPLLPLLKEGIISPRRIVINSISGISGAGKKLLGNLLFCERTENAGAYSPGRSHRHLLEIEDQMKYVNKEAELFFTPHLAPLKRGMSTTIFTDLTREVSREEVLAIYDKYYASSPFINIRSSIPQTGDVWGSNRCDIYPYIEGRQLMLFSVIDNLVKGAAGQCLQAMNVRFGLEETLGLKQGNEL